MKPLNRTMGLFSLVMTTMASAQSQVAMPAAGLWEISTTLEGAPMGGATRTGTSCLRADTLTAAPEQTLIEAANREGSDRQGPRCEIKAVRRTGRDASWESVCLGPMGRMQGTGSGTLSEDRADLQQTFAVSAPIGSLNLKQTVSARRIGNCQ